jgi:hypothetical protein
MVKVLALLSMWLGVRFLEKIWLERENPPWWLIDSPVEIIITNDGGNFVQCRGNQKNIPIFEIEIYVAYTLFHYLSILCVAMFCQTKVIGPKWLMSSC